MGPKLSDEVVDEAAVLYRDELSVAKGASACGCAGSPGTRLDEHLSSKSAHLRASNRRFSASRFR